MKKRVEELDPDALEQLRADWSAGLLPARTIAVKFGVDVGELRLYAATNNWEPSDLTKEVRRSANTALIQRAVSEDDKAAGRTSPRVLGSTDMVEQYGHIVAQVTESQRTALRQARNYVMHLFEQLGQLHGPPVDEEALKALAQLIAPENPQLAEALTKVSDPTPFKERLEVMQVKASIVDRLSRVIKLLIETERTVWGMSDKAGEKATDFDSLLDRLHSLTTQSARKRVS